MQKIEKLISPWNEYRLKWDLMLENVEIIQKWSEEEVFKLNFFYKQYLFLGLFSTSFCKKTFYNICSRINRCC